MCIAGHRLIIGSRVPMMAGEANKFGGFVYDVLVLNGRKKIFL